MSIIVTPIYRYVAQIFVCNCTMCTIDLNLNLPMIGRIGLGLGSDFGISKGD